MRPLFLKELRLAVIASWRNIPCTRIHTAATDAVKAVCVTFLNPLNGLWFGLGLFLLLCIPVLIFSVKLVNLYRKTEKYSPDYEQPYVWTPVLLQHLTRMISFDLHSHWFLGTTFPTTPSTWDPPTVTAMFHLEGELSPQSLCKNDCLTTESPSCSSF